MSIRKRQRWVRIGIAQLVGVSALALVLVACSSGASEPSGTPSGTPVGPETTVVTIPTDRELPHIHGAGFDVATGLVYAGTHEGVWQVTGTGAASAVGTSRDDLMGFSISSADSWYSSGHPGAGSGAANPLGLIHSADRGRTWNQVSLGGQVDFHALTAKGATVVGVDGSSTVMLSSTGGSAWSTGASMPASSLAFAGDSVLAASKQGLARSTDSGVSFTAVTSAPKIVLLSAGAAGSVWGVDTAGVAWSSADSGLNWTRRASVGAVHALAAVDATTSYAITPSSLIKIG